MKHVRSWAGVGLVVLLVAAPLSACGSSSKSKADAGSTGSTVATSGSIKVGSIIPATNIAGGIALPQMRVALEAAVKGFNKRGGVAGKKLDLVVCDSKGDPNEEANCARRMVTEKVAATLSDYTFFNGDADAKILGDAGIPRIGINTSGLAEWHSPVTFALDAGPLAFLSAIGVELIKQGHKKLAFVVVQTPQSGAIAALMKPGIKAAGGEIVTQVFVPPGTTDYSRFVAAATKDGATAAMLALGEEQQAPFFDAMSQLNSKLVPAISANTPSLNQLEKYAKFTTAAVMVGTTPNANSDPKEFPGLKLFVQDMKAGGLDIADVNGQSENPWVSVLALKTVVETAKPATVDAASVLAALKAAKDVDLQGMIPPWTPSRTDPSPIFTNISNPYLFSQRFDGKSVKTLLPPIDGMQILDTKA